MFLHTCKICEVGIHWEKVFVITTYARLVYTSLLTPSF